MGGENGGTSPFFHSPPKYLFLQEAMMEDAKFGSDNHMEYQVCKYWVSQKIECQESVFSTAGGNMSKHQTIMLEECFENINCTSQHWLCHQIHLEN